MGETMYPFAHDIMTRLPTLPGIRYLAPRVCSRTLSMVRPIESGSKDNMADGGTPPQAGKGS